MRLLTTKTVMTILLSIFLLNACSWFMQDDVQEPQLDEFSPDIEQTVFEGHGPNVAVQSHVSVTSRSLSTAITNITCNRQTNELSFRITNNADVIWSVDRLAESDDEDLINLRLFFNTKMVNSRATIFDEVSGERLFGPNILLSDNCGQVRLLRPQNSMQCTLQPVLFQEENTLRIEGDSRGDQITFRCEE